MRTLCVSLGPCSSSTLSFSNYRILQQSLFKAATNGQRNNTNPRGTATLSHYRKICPTNVFEKAERAEACHMNSMENAPFFIGAVVAGNFAGLSPCKPFFPDYLIRGMQEKKGVLMHALAATMNTVAGAYLGLRVLYSVLYINVEDTKTSFLRSGTWFAGVVLLATTYVKAGMAMNSA
jgi:uncharacterized MAPEG superfamily protein